MQYHGVFCGGGVRGALDSCLFVAIEQQAGCLMRDVFKAGVSGTSTGALQSAAIAVGIPATHILEIYQKRLWEIFRHGSLSFPLEISRGYADDPLNIRRVLESEFGKSAAWTMNDCPIKTMICAAGMDHKPWYFVNANPKNSGLTGNVLLIDAAMASAAAPVYFDHATIPVNGKLLRLYDGGVIGLANPTYQACTELFEYDSFAPADTRVITFGTGYFPSPDVPPQGLLGDVIWAIDTLVDSSEDWVDRACAGRTDWAGVTTKLNWKLPRSIGMADIGAVDELITEGKKWAAGIDWVKLLQL